MIDYYDELTQEEREELAAVIQLLYRQTFLLERKYEKRLWKLQPSVRHRSALISADKWWQALEVSLPTVPRPEYR